MKTCKKCKQELTGKMIFFPELCLSCVIDVHTKKGKANE